LRWASSIAAGLAAALMAVSFGGPAPAAEPAAQLARVQTALEREEGVRAVKRLQNALSQYLEEGRWSELGALFAAEAAGRFGDDAAAGRPAIVRHFMKDADRATEGLAQGQLNEHWILQPIVNLGADGRTAKGTWHEVAMTGRTGGSAVWSGGIWENDYALQGGVWRITAVRFFPQYKGGYDEPGFKAPARWDIAYHFQPAHVGLTIPPSALTPGPVTATPVELSRRAMRLQDETAVSNLQHAMGYYLDRKLWDDLADLFADGGRLELGGQSPAAGRAAIRKALEKVHGGPGLSKGELFDHILTGTVVTVAPDGLHAFARSSSLGQLGLNGQGARWEIGTWENAFAKQGGTWKLTAARFHPRLVADYDKSWAKDPGATLKTERIALSFPNPGRASPRPQGPGGSLEQAERAVQAAIGVDATENLNSAYGYYIDESDWDGMADIYSRDGAKEITGVGTYVGSERIRKVLKLRGPLGGRTPNFYTIHQLVQPVIHVSEDGRSAKARLRLFQLGGDADGSAGSWIGGIYENTAVLQDGEWKLQVQDLHHLFNAPYSSGWARVGQRGQPAIPGVRPQGAGLRQGLGGARAPGAFAADFPPDRPIRVLRQYAFPEIVEPAFHYRNPVSGRAPAELLP
jgi:hypothetical protein